MKRVLLLCCWACIVLTWPFPTDLSKEASKASSDLRESGDVSISLSGDMLFSRGVGKAISEKGFEYPYLQIKEKLKSVDISVGNLECPLSDDGVPVLKDPSIVFKGDPKNAYYLKDAGFDVVNLANNHAMDQGRLALQNTKDALDKAGVVSFGAGGNYKEAHKPVFVKKKGTTFGFIGFSVFPAEGYFYSSEKADVSLINDDTLAEISAAKKMCDFLIVSFHWGVEFSTHKTDTQTKLAHLAIDNGADLIVGHHPHVVQDVEKYDGKYIFYSLGNFIFDYQKRPGTDAAIMPILRIRDSRVTDVEVVRIGIRYCQPWEYEEIPYVKNTE